MALRPVLDLDLLRSFLFVAEEASFTKAAARVGRTQSAVSLQIQKLEAVLGQPLVVRSRGGGVVLTPHGEALTAPARAMLALNDEAFRAMDGAEATVRLGLSAGYAPFFLAPALERVRSQRPNLKVEVVEAYSCQLGPKIADEAFDLVLCDSGHEPRRWPSEPVWRGPLKWIAAVGGTAHRRQPLPLCLTPRDCPWRPSWMEDCFWRTAALHALQRAGRPFEIVATANTMEGLYAPVIADEAVTISLGGALPPGARALADDEGLPPLPEFEVILVRSRRAAQPFADIVSAAIREEFRVVLSLPR